MDYEELKDEIKTIAEISNSVPETFRVRCFELLLEHLLGGNRRKTSQAGSSSASLDTAPNVGAASGLAGGGSDGEPIPLPPQVKLFLNKTGVTQEDLSKLLMFDGENLYYIREPSSSKSIARGQIEWTLLAALENAILNNNLSADLERARTLCQEKQFYDAPNFLKNFKSAKNAKLFQGPLDGQNPIQRLSNDGQTELGHVVKEILRANP